MEKAIPELNIRIKTYDKKATIKSLSNSPIFENDNIFEEKDKVKAIDLDKISQSTDLKKEEKVISPLKPTIKPDEKNDRGNNIPVIIETFSIDDSLRSAPKLNAIKLNQIKNNETVPTTSKEKVALKKEIVNNSTEKFEIEPSTTNTSKADNKDSEKKEHVGTANIKPVTSKTTIKKITKATVENVKPTAPVVEPKVVPTTKPVLQQPVVNTVKPTVPTTIPTAIKTNVDVKPITPVTTPIATKINTEMVKPTTPVVEPKVVPTTIPTAIKTNVDVKPITPVTTPIATKINTETVKPTTPVAEPKVVPTTNIPIPSIVLETKLTTPTTINKGKEVTPIAKVKTPIPSIVTEEKVSNDKKIPVINSPVNSTSQVLTEAITKKTTESKTDDKKLESPTTKVPEKTFLITDAKVNVIKPTTIPMTSSFITEAKTNTLTQTPKEIKQLVTETKITPNIKTEKQISDADASKIKAILTSTEKKPFITEFKATPITTSPLKTIERNSLVTEAKTTTPLTSQSVDKTPLVNQAKTSLEKKPFITEAKIATTKQVSSKTQTTKETPNPIVTEAKTNTVPITEIKVAPKRSFITEEKIVSLKTPTTTPTIDKKEPIKEVKTTTPIKQTTNTIPLSRTTLPEKKPLITETKPNVLVTPTTKPLITEDKISLVPKTTAPTLPPIEKKTLIIETKNKEEKIEAKKDNNLVNITDNKNKVNTASTSPIEIKTPTVQVPKHEENNKAAVKKEPIIKKKSEESNLDSDGDLPILGED